MRWSLAALVLAFPLALAACGSETDVATDEPTSAASSSETPDPAESPSLEVRPDRPDKTCSKLYFPPGQLMPRAIEMVHHSPSGEDASKATELAAKLADAEERAVDEMAVQIAVVRAGVEAVGAGESVDLDEFDAATTKLGGRCEMYID